MSSNGTNKEYAFKNLVNQSDKTKNNYVYYSGNGVNNNVNITQSGNSSTQADYSYTTLSGNNNTINVTQTSTGGAKGATGNTGSQGPSITNNSNITWINTGTRNGPIS